MFRTKVAATSPRLRLHGKQSTHGSASTQVAPVCSPLGVGILSAIGNTPLVELVHLGVRHARLYAKLDLFNPGGSSKDRPALFMLRDALERKLLGPDSVVVESSSGNMAIGLA